MIWRKPLNYEAGDNPKALEKVEKEPEGLKFKQLSNKVIPPFPFGPLHFVQGKKLAHAFGLTVSDLLRPPIDEAELDQSVGDVVLAVIPSRSTSSTRSSVGNRLAKPSWQVGRTPLCR